MSIAFFNNEYLPLAQVSISPLDRGFLFADSVYEVIPVYDGETFGGEGHVKRLLRSMAEIQLRHPWAQGQWLDMFRELVARNGGGDCAIYLQVTRGVMAKRDHAIPAEYTPTVFAMVTPIAEPMGANVESATGIKAITVSDIRWARCDIKSTALLANVLMKQQAMDQGGDDVILLREDGMLSESAAANVFIVRGEQLLTPPEGDEILSGITRRIIIDMANEQNVAIAECHLNRSDLEQADEIWVTSSTRELVPVVDLNGQAVGSGKPGALWKRFASAYQQAKRQRLTKPGE